jgi:hypothetical protein
MCRLLLITAFSFLSGCESVTGTPNQNVSVQTRSSNGKEIKEAACDLINKRGTWFITTPGTVQIHRSNDDLQVTCRKEGFDNGRASVVLDTKGSMFGNILLGGGIGAVVDHNNGSAYEYLSFIQVTMGIDSLIGTPRDNAAESTNTRGSRSAPIKKEKIKPEAQGRNYDSMDTIQSLKKQSQQDKLKQLKDLYEQNLISQEIYIEKQKNYSGEKLNA